jgi:3-oxoadipate enol-lactonase
MEQQLNTARGDFRIALDGEASLPALLLSNSLGTTLEMWKPQVDELSKNFHVIRYDTRGHGGSPITPGPYEFKDLGADVLAIMDALEVDRGMFCGLSMGGHTGLWLAINAAKRFQAIAVCNSAARIGTVDGWRERAASVRQGGVSGMHDLAKSAPSRWFTDQFITRSPDIVKQTQQGLENVSPEGYAACCDALATSDLRGDLPAINTPMLFLAGLSDPVTTLLDAQQMQCLVSTSQLKTIAASHLSNIEAPHEFTNIVSSFLSQQKFSN